MLEVWDQGVNRVGFFLGFSYCLLFMSSHGLPLVCLFLIFSSYKDTSYIGLQPTYMTLFELNCLFKGSNIVIFWGTKD